MSGTGDERFTPDESARAILERRARNLARPAASDMAPVDAREVLVCTVGDERIAFPLANIVAVSRVGRIARLPRVSAPVYGVTAWRGRPLTVLSVAAGAVVPGELSRLVVLGAAARASVAVVVDAVDDVANVAHGDLVPADAGPRRGYALGITHDGVLVLDGSALLNPESLSS